MPASERTFLLGLGCMKGGTTWLHRHLAASPQCEPGFRKEYHVWDSIDSEHEPWQFPRILDRAGATLEQLRTGRHRGTREPLDVSHLRLAAMIADERIYFDYFAELFARDAATRLTLDITPAYASLSTDRLAMIRREMDGRGIRAVALFLLRDPVERIWSQVRMQKRRRPATSPGTDEELVLQRYADPVFAERTAYEHTVARADEAFGDDTAYAFYERLFDPDRAESELRRISAAAGVDHRSPDLETRFNASPRDSALSEPTVRRVAEHYRATYSFVAERFPEVDLLRIWPSARFAL